MRKCNVSEKKNPVNCCNVFIKYHPIKDETLPAIVYSFLTCMFCWLLIRYHLHRVPILATIDRIKDGDKKRQLSVWEQIVTVDVNSKQVDLSYQQSLIVDFEVRWVGSETDKMSEFPPSLATFSVFSIMDFLHIYIFYF